VARAIRTGEVCVAACARAAVTGAATPQALAKRAASGTEGPLSSSGMWLPPLPRSRPPGPVSRQLGPALAGVGVGPRSAQARRGFAEQGTTGAPIRTSNSCARHAGVPPRVGKETAAPGGCTPASAGRPSSACWKGDGSTSPAPAPANPGGRGVSCPGSSVVIRAAVAAGESAPPASAARGRGLSHRRGLELARGQPAPGTGLPCTADRALVSRPSSWSRAAAHARTPGAQAGLVAGLSSRWRAAWLASSGATCGRDGTVISTWCEPSGPCDAIEGDQVSGARPPIPGRLNSCSTSNLLGQPARRRLPAACNARLRFPETLCAPSNVPAKCDDEIDEWERD
jgi:hypothetical protein